MKKILGFSLASVIALGGSVALAGAEVGSWYVAPSFQGVWVDNKRNADDSGGFGLALGRTMSPNWDTEFTASTSTHDQAAGAKLELTNLGIAVHRVFYRDARFTPFLSLGVTVGSTGVTGQALNRKLGAFYGVGLLADITKNSAKGAGLQARGEVLARRTSGTNGSSFGGDLTDYLAGVGLQYSWGAPIKPKAPLDSDGDGVPDDMDKCPGTPAGVTVNADGCEPVVEKDSDSDGVFDGADKCPDTPAGTKVDSTGCEPDSDGDGVVDSKDQCPDTPKGDRVDSFGCSYKKELNLPGVEFDINKADLRTDSTAILDGAAAVLKRYPLLDIEIDGHTDSDASDVYNQTLSEQRAAAVVKYLQDQGVTNKLTSRGFGESQPIASNKSAAGKQKNRRVVLRVLN